jgi:integrase
MKAKQPLPDRRTPLDKTQTYGNVRGVTLFWHHGSWVLRFNLDGVRDEKTLATASDEWARHWLTVTEGEVAKGQRRHAITVYGARPAGGLRFRDAAVQCFAEKRRTQGAVENTLFNWEHHLARFVNATLGDRYVTTIGREDIKAVLLKCLATPNRFGRPNSKGTAGVVLGAVRVVFNWLITEGKLKGRDGLDLANPCTGLRELLRDRVADDVRRRVQPFREEEQQRVVEYFRAHASPAWQRWWLMVALAFRTGLRIGELIALKLEDLDLERRTVTVRRTWTSCLYRNAQGKPVAGVQEFPKGKRIRLVHLAQAMIPELAAHCAGRAAENRARRWSGSWLFVNTEGRPTSRPTFEQHLWVPALRELGLAGRRFHNTRHTFASNLLYATKDFRYVSRQLGHSQERTTALYTHVMEELEQHLVDLVPDAPAPPAAPAVARRPLAKARKAAAVERPLAKAPGRDRARPGYLRVVHT